MSERNEYPTGVPCWIDTLQDDAAAAAGFYASLFGWDLVGPTSMPDEPSGRYFVARLRGRDAAGIGSLPAGVEPQPAWSTYIRVASADETAAAATGAGGTVVVEPFDVPPAGRMAVLADSTGAQFCVWEPGARQGAQVVNEPGAWAMSHLTTPAAGEAAAFYGAVFGWTTEQFGDGEKAVTTFRLPGYVGGEPEQPVSREVVATMAVASGDSAKGLGPHWSTDFWTADVDSAATKATELGGRVVLGPFDTPVGRTAVLADPQGVSFSVSEIAARR
jgi:uncharacterized protein